MLGLVVTFVLQKPKTNGATVSNAILATQEESVADPLDTISSADIALDIAKATNLPETVSVSNLADTLNAQLTVTPANNIVVTQPQIITDSIKSRADIVIYKVLPGDNIATIAEKFGVTSDTIRWSNGLSGNNVTEGSEIVISPVDGIVYEVRGSDTIDDLVARYRVNKEQFVAFNDLESGNLPVGQRVVLPDGQPPVSTGNRVAYSSANGFVPSYGSSNGYDFGYCTWYAANKRAALGRAIPSNLGNASTWLSRAAAAGFGTGRVPQAGAVIWTPPRDFYGHVGFVESVNQDGSVNVSEMNTRGWNVISTKTLSAAEAARYSYIY